MQAHDLNGHVPDAPKASPGGQTHWLATRPWATFVVPFVVYGACGSLEPSVDKPFEMLGISIDYAAYPLVYTVKIALTLLAILAVWPGYRQFPFRLTLLAPLIGLVGGGLWIALCKLELEATLLGPLGYDQIADLGRRPGYNPLVELSELPLLAYGFLAIRMLGLVAIVPLIEEFFIRGFVMRFVIDADWPKVPFGTLTPTAIVAGTLLPVLMHPAELFAAAVWFTLVTWLMFKTRNIWDCVVAHAVTNGTLGVWALGSGDWSLL